jgi:hypothetical protein
MKTKKQFDAEIKAKGREFLTAALEQGVSLDTFNRVWATPKGAKGVNIGLWVLKYIVDYAAGITVIEPNLQTLYSEYIVPLSRQQSGLLCPTFRNFHGLNNEIRRLNPTHLKSVGGMLEWEPVLELPVIGDIVNYWWQVAQDGYFTAHKNKAHKTEQSVISLNDKRACTPDGGIDGYRSYEGKVYAQDHKDIHLACEDFLGLLVRPPANDFCISTTQGIKRDVLDPKTGFIGQRLQESAKQGGWAVVGMEIACNTSAGNVMYFYFTRKEAQNGKSDNLFF